jgi:hypothetical protein
MRNWDSCERGEVQEDDSAIPRSASGSNMLGGTRIFEIPESITNGRYPGDYGTAKKELHFGLVARVIPH